MIGVLQVVFCENTDPNTLTISESITVAAGSTIYIGSVHNSNGFTSSSMTCTAYPGGSPPTVTKIGSTVNDPPGNQGYEHFYVVNPGAGSYTFQYDVVDDGTHWLDMFLAEIGGGATSAILVANGPGQYQGNPGTSTDEVTSGTAQTPTGYPALVIGYSCDAQCSLTPSPGTGFNDEGSGFGFFGYGAGGRVVSKRITSGNAQTTFTVGATSGTIVTMMAAFLEAGSGGSTVDVDAGTDTPAVTDTLLAAASYHRSVSDSVGVSDSVTAETGGSKEVAVSDSVSCTDGAATSLAYGRQASDAVDATDGATLELSIGFTDDTVSTTDSVSTGMAYGRSLSDSVSTSDTVSTGTTYGRTLSDSATASDAVSIEAGGAKEISATDAVDVTDVASRSVDYTRPLSDTLSTTDTLTTWADYARALSDTVSTSDAASTELTSGSVKEVVLSDTLSMSDGLSTWASYVRGGTDAININDDVSITGVVPILPKSQGVPGRARRTVRRTPA